MEGALKMNFWKPTLFATATILVSTGIRNTVGLLVNPLVENTLLSLTQISMAMAIGQFTYGLFQPLGGFLTTRYRTFSVLFAGVICLIMGFLGIRFSNSVFLVILCFGLLAPAGAAASSFPILMGHISKSVPDEKRSFSGGLINAGGSAGQFVLAPLIQICLNTYGLYGACIFLASAAALSLVPSWLLCYSKKERSTAACKSFDTEKIPTNVSQVADLGLKEEIIKVFHNPAYLFLHCGFFACGFHVAFIATHLPGEIIFWGFSGSFSAFCFSILGVCNIAGCIFVGIMGGVFKLKNILAALYFIRLLLIGVYIFVPKTTPVFIIFAAITGLTFGATVPPTGAITARLVQPQNLSTIFALIFLTHQAGSFFGAWLGGLIMDHTGSFMPIWILDAALSLFAATVSFMINEVKTKY